MTAALPMYSRPETRAAEARLWAAMRAHGWDGVEDAPEDLQTPSDLWAFWHAPGLVFSQTCGMPYRLMSDRPTLLGTPVHPLDVAPGTYHSVVITRADIAGDPRGLGTAPLAYNEPRSQSGWAAAWGHGLGRGATLQTGSHRASAVAVAAARADVATIDCVTWALLKRYEPATLDTLSVIATTTPRPALPFVTRIADVDGLRTALRHAVTRLSRDDQDTLMLCDILDVASQTYMAVPNPPPPQN